MTPSSPDHAALPVPARGTVGVHSAASLAFDAIRNLLPTRLFHYITFITRFFLTSSPIPTLSPQSQAGWLHSWAEIGNVALKSFLLLGGGT